MNVFALGRAYAVIRRSVTVVLTSAPGKLAAAGFFLAVAPPV